MNWYKISQQMSFNFPEAPSHVKEPEHYTSVEEFVKNVPLEEAVEYDATSEWALFQILKNYGIQYEIVQLADNERILTFDHNHKRCIIKLGTSNYEVEDALKFIQDVSWSGNIWNYYPDVDFNKEFWDGVREGYKLYHGTTKENFELIMKNGLEVGYGTRGISNRSTGAAVFTSDSEDTTIYFYDKVIEIDVGGMKKDGYMPRVSKEEPIQEAEIIEALAWKLGIENYNSETEDGLYPGTIIFYNNIPVKYLREIK